MALVNVLIVVGTSIALVPAWFFVLEVIGRFLPSQHLPASGRRPSAIVIVPAHNEAQGLPPTLKAIMRDPLHPTIIVVADNCTDDTAARAREALFDYKDAIVVERVDQDRRGKGYALEHGLGVMRERLPSVPQIVIFVDADCRPAPGALDAIATRAHQLNTPVQALYLMERPEDASHGGDPRQAIAAFAWMIMNRIRMDGLHRLFGVTRLTGSGMAFPTAILDIHFSGSGEIVEDLALTVTLVKAGLYPHLMTEARIYSQLPDKAEASVAQRARWERGSMSVARRAVPSLLRAALDKRDIRPLALALDLTIPPLVLLVAFLLLMTALTFVWMLMGGASTAFALVLWTLFAMAAGLIAAWMNDGRSLLRVRDLAGVAGFVRQKAKIHGATGRDSTRVWTRTDRDDAPSP